MSEAARFIAEIVEDPDDEARWLVYADWLIGRGDPRGELINLELAVEATGAVPGAPVEMDGAAVAAWEYPNHDHGPTVELARQVDRMRNRQERWLSPRLNACLDAWRLVLWRSFIRSAALCERDDEANPEPVEALFADPHACLLDHLGIADTEPAWRTAVFAAPRPWLRSLVTCGLGDYGAHLDDYVPRLDHLVLSGCDPEFVAFSHDQLTSLVADQATCPAACIGKFRATRLRRLVWGTVGADRLLFDPRSILHAPPPILSELELRRPPDDFDGEALFAALTETAIGATLESLEVSWGTIAGIERLAAARARFPKLRRIVIGEHRWIQRFENVLLAAREELPAEIRDTPEGQHQAVQIALTPRDTDEAIAARELLCGAFPGVEVVLGADLHRLAERLSSAHRLLPAG